MDNNVTVDSNVSVDQLLSVVNNTLAATSNTIAHTDSMVSIYLGLFTAITVVLTIIVQFYLARDKRKQIVSAVKHITSNIAQDENLRNQLISEILKDPEFKNDFFAFIDVSVRDKLDDLIPEDTNVVSRQKIQKGLQS